MQHDFFDGLEMYSPIQIIDSLFDSFDQGGIHSFREYMKNQNGVTKWMIASDYCLHDNTRPSDAIAFTLIPYDDWFPNIRDRIKAAIPYDIKKTKNITDATIKYLRQRHHFHFGIVLDKNRDFFGNESNSNRLRVARDSIKLTVDHTIENERGADRIARIKKLANESLANGFNVNLLEDMLLLSSFYAFICLLIARESKPEIIGWFSDRDSLTTWCEGIIYDFTLENILGLSKQRDISIHSNNLIFAKPDLASANDVMWFDELIRVADFFAGTLAAWDIKKNLVLKDKFGHMLREVIADSSNTVILKFRIDKLGLQTSRVLVNKMDAIPTLYIGVTSISVSRKQLFKVAGRLFKQPELLRLKRIARAKANMHHLLKRRGLEAVKYQGQLRSLAVVLLSQGITRL